MSTPIQRLFDLEGKIALVTGGSRGLGLQIAEALGEAGAKIMLTSRKASDLEHSAAHLQDKGIDTRWIAADASRPEEVRRVAEEAMQRLGRVDILVSNNRATEGNNLIEGRLCIAQTAGTGTTRTATNFKVTVTIDGQIPEVRPGFTCTAEITTATKKQALSVPIQALTVRELLYDAQGNIVHDKRPPRTGFRFGPPQAAPVAAPAELKPGEKREEVEGVFLMKDGKSAFTIVKTGIAGERYLEVLSGLKEGEQVITGPFDSVRGMYEGDMVKTAPKPGEKK